MSRTYLLRGSCLKKSSLVGKVPDAVHVPPKVDTVGVHDCQRVTASAQADAILTSCCVRCLSHPIARPLEN
jgi:hypothetical protein